MNLSPAFPDPRATWAGANAPWLEDLDPEAIEAAAGELRACAEQGGVVVIAAHVGPDADALGAALALHLALSRLGARSVPTVGERPLKVPAPLAALPGIDAVAGPDELPAPDDVSLLVTVDAASPQRLGSVADYLDAGVPTLVVDHHARGEGFGDLRLVAPHAAATVQIVAHLLEVLDVELDPELATCLYVGLVTDTGRFGHATTDAAVHELAATLLRTGIDHAMLTRRLYDTRSLAELRVIGRALDRAGFVPDVALVHTYVTEEELARAGGGIETLEALVDLLRSVDVAEVALVLKPAEDDTWRASLRARGEVDVAALAARFGGGGHTAAAGFSAHGAPDAVVEDVLAVLREQRRG